MVTFDGYRRGTTSRNENSGSEVNEKRVPPSSVYFRDNDTLSATNPLNINIQSPLSSAATATAAAARSRVSFFFLFYTLFRFSLFCGLRRFALQLIISPLSYPLSRRRLSLSLFRFLSFSLPSIHSHTPLVLLSRSLSHHYYTRPYTAIMPRPRYTTQSAVMPAIKLN